jgi:hypothetical protein
MPGFWVATVLSDMCCFAGRRIYRFTEEFDAGKDGITLQTSEAELKV